MLPVPAVRRVLPALLTLITAVAHAGYQEGMDALLQRDNVRARAEFESDRGNAKSLYQLAVMAREGRGEPRNLTKAAGLFKQAADLGDERSALEYAFALGNGIGVDGDGAAAIAALERLVARNNIDAMVALGRALRMGWWGQAKDEARSTQLFGKAAAAGDANGRLHLAQALLEGIGGPKDVERGLGLLREGVAQGHPASQMEYAMLLSLGEVLPRDEAASLALYRKVAERADRSAQYWVGMALLNGRGTERDEKTAVRWLDASARQGHAFAQLQLGDLYRTGRALPQRNSEAYYWYALAARSNVAGVIERANAQRSQLAPLLQPAQLTAIAARVGSFVAQPGIRPRATPLPPPSHDDRIELGGTSLRVPAPRGFVNGWQALEAMQATFPNDSDLAVLMVLNATEDMDRLRLGLPGRIRTIEINRNSPDDTVRVTPALFGEVKAQARRTLESAAPAARPQIEAVLRDDEDAFSVLRRSQQDPSRLEALSLLRVRERVILLAYVGFDAEQRGGLTELVRSTTDEILSANRGGLFSGR